MTNIKLKLLQKYCKIQAYDKALWRDPQTIFEDYIQRELRLLVTMIENGTEDDIMVCLTKKSEMNNEQ